MGVQINKLEVTMMNYMEHFARTPNVCNGHTVIKGTRVPVQVVLDNLAAGLGVEEIVKSYPSLTSGNVKACIAYAAEAVREEELYPAAQAS